MRCPHCNQEHPDNYKFCPVTGKELELLKACTLNPDCPDHGRHILPLDSLFCPTCGCKLENSTQSVDHGDEEETYVNEHDDTVECPACSSDEVEDDGSNYLQFTCNDCGHNWGHDDTVECPECGSNDVENDGSDNLQYECNNCGHIWGDDNEEEDDSEDSDDNEDELHTFFPILGITLGETTVEEAEEQNYLYHSIDYEEDGTVYARQENSNGSIGALISKQPYEEEFSSVYITHSDDMFEEWENLGFDWSLSYNEWLQLFQERGYEIDIITPPHKEYYEERDYWYLNACFLATAPDYSLIFRLDFSFGENGHKQKSNGTLYAMWATNDVDHVS